MEKKVFKFKRAKNSFLTSSFVIFTVTILVLSISSFVLRAQDCKSSFEFLNTTNEKKSSDSGVKYRLELINLSKEKVDYIITLKDITSENNEQGLSVINFSLIDFSLMPITDRVEGSKNTYILKNLNPKESIIFYVHIEVEKRVNETNKSQIILKTKNCPEFKLTKEVITSYEQGE